jgi:radical SAM protein with 4Fe4S-binding SPASM domain
MERENSPDLDDARELLSTLNGGCSAGTRVANIDPKGNVYPCQFARSPEFLVGTIRNLPFSRLWTDPENDVLTGFREKTRHLTGKCRDCRYLALCGGGCRVRAFAVNGDFFADDPFCFAGEGDTFLNL